MKKNDQISYSYQFEDYIINDLPLKVQLLKHEKIDPKSYMPSFLGQPSVTERLTKQAPPDLQKNHVAIYLCSHCGGYDGTPIGVEIEINDKFVSWKNIGYFSDIEEFEGHKFIRIREFKFDRDNYNKFIISLKPYKLK